MIPYWIGFAFGTAATLAGYAAWCYSDRAAMRWWEVAGGGLWAVPIAVSVGWVLGTVLDAL